MKVYRKIITTQVAEVESADAAALRDMSEDSQIEWEEAGDAVSEVGTYTTEDDDGVPTDATPIA